MTSSSRDDHAMLGALIAADDAAGDPKTHVLTYSFAGPKLIGHPGWPEDDPAPTDVQVDELEGLGWVRVGQRDGKQRHFAVTGEGRRAWRAHVAAQAQVAAGGRVSLDWPAARRLLEEIHDEYLEHGAPEVGVDMLPMISDEDTGRATAAILRELVRGGFLDVGFESADGPRSVRPTIVTLQVMEGWPVSPAQDVLNELVAALDGEIAVTSDAEKRSKLVQVRDGLMGAARDIAVAYIERKLGA